MPVIKLTAQMIPGLHPKDATREETYRDAVCRGLLLEAHPSGVKTFVCWGYVKGTGRACRVKLGRWREGVYNLKDARTDAIEALHTMAVGRDPALEKRQAKAAGTFGALCETFLKEAPMRPTTREEWTRLLNGKHLRTFRERKTSEVTRSDVVRLLDTVRKDSISKGGKGTVSNRVLELVRRAYSWAVERDLVGASPCVGVRKLTKELPRTRSYSDAELGAIVRALREDRSPMAGACLLACYTGVRIGAALGARQSEISGDVWTIPGTRSGVKNGLDHVAPLSDSAKELLRSWPGDPVFGPRADRRQKTVYRIRAASGVRDWTPHDFRRCVNSWLASMAGGAVSLEVRDAVLGHAARGTLERVYNQYDYFDEKKATLARWARHVDRVAEAQPAKVLAMPGVGA